MKPNQRRLPGGPRVVGNPTAGVRERVAQLTKLPEVALDGVARGEPAVELFSILRNGHDLPEPVQVGRVEEVRKVPRLRGLALLRSFVARPLHQVLRDDVDGVAELGEEEPPKLDFDVFHSY